MNKIVGVILAAGLGKRMNSSIPKVIHSLCGKPMIEYIIDSLKKTGIKNIISVIGHEKEKIQKVIGTKTLFAVQEKQLGTGDALKKALPIIKEKFEDTENIILCCGDTPLLTSELFKNIIRSHKSKNSAATVVTSIIDDPYGYGRIIKDKNNCICEIKEEKDCDNEQKKIKEINSGLYVFKFKELIDSIELLTSNNSQNEYYLTDIIDILYKNGSSIYSYCENDPTIIEGINNKYSLSKMEDILLENIKKEHMLNGVTIKNPNSVYIVNNIEIGKNTIIKGPVYIEENVIIENNCSIGPFVYLKNSNVLKDSKINCCSLINNKLSSFFNGV